MHDELETYCWKYFHKNILFKLFVLGLGYMLVPLKKISSFLNNLWISVLESSKEYQGYHSGRTGVALKARVIEVVRNSIIKNARSGMGKLIIKKNLLHAYTGELSGMSEKKKGLVC